MENIKFKDIDKQILYNNKNYIIEFEECFDDELIKLLDKYKHIFERVGDKAGILNFGNFIGDTWFLGKKVQVRSDKIDNNDYYRMLDYIVERISQLPFDFNTPTFTYFNMDDQRSPSVLYHTFLVLRYLVMRSNNNIEDVYTTVFNNLNRENKEEDVIQTINELTNVSSKTIYGIVQRPEYLKKIESGNKLLKTTLAKKINSRCNKNLFPEKYHNIRIIKSYDTPENRFIKYFLKICINILYKFQDSLYKEVSKNKTKAILNFEELMQQINNMLEVLETLLNNSVFRDVKEMIIIPFNSMVLQKREGYKEILRFYNLIQNSLSLNIFEHNINLIIENKDVATLYEIWTYFKVIEAVEDLLKIKPLKAYTVKNNNFRQTLGYSNCVEYKYNGEKIKIWYNKIFRRSEGAYSTYSLTLRPDIVIEVKNKLYIFDAKFKISNLNWDLLDNVEEDNKKFKSEDIYKMHTYKDAIRNVKLACIIYPNPNGKSAFFEDTGIDTGVGAIPLTPRTEDEELREFLKIRCLSNL